MMRHLCPQFIDFFTLAPVYELWYNAGHDSGRHQAMRFAMLHPEAYSTVHALSLTNLAFEEAVLKGAGRNGVCPHPYPVREDHCANVHHRGHCPGGRCAGNHPPLNFFVRRKAVAKKKKKFWEIWSSQTELGKKFGISAIEVGKILIPYGLKDPNTKEATQKALDDGYAKFTPLQDGTPHYMWNIEKVQSLLLEKHQPLSQVDYWTDEVVLSLNP